MTSPLQRLRVWRARRANQRTGKVTSAHLDQRDRQRIVSRGKRPV